MTEATVARIIKDHFSAAAPRTDGIEEALRIVCRDLAELKDSTATLAARADPPFVVNVKSGTWHRHAFGGGHDPSLWVTSCAVAYGTRPHIYQRKASLEPDATTCFRCFGH